MRRYQYWTIFLTKAALAMLISCGGKSAATETPAPDPCAGDPCAVEDEGDPNALDVSDWSSWTQINDAPVRSDGHNNQWVTVYVTNDHADTYRNLGTDGMPVGMKIAKVVHTDENDAPGEVKMVTVMAKMEAGYDADNGDWYYGVYNATGESAKMSGKLEKCIGCHESYADTDYLGGMPQSM